MEARNHDGASTRKISTSITSEIACNKTGEQDMTIKCAAGRRFNSIEGTRRLLLALLLSLTALAMADRAVAETHPVEFSIPAQTVPAALNAFARQAHTQLFFITNGFENVQANAVFGTYPRQQALDLLLAGTGLTASYSSDSGIKVRPVSTSMNLAATGSRMFVAAGAVAGADNYDERIYDDAQNNSLSGTDEKVDEIFEEIIVTGTHIRGVDNVGAASITFTREQLAKTGFSTVEELFQSLPQNLDEISADGALADGTSQVAGANIQGATSISLRGLGPGSTLVLLNGKRRPGNIRGRAVDVSAIPLSMIESVEVVTGGRSAIYGSDAVAGVVNIVTRADYDGAETQVYYGESSAGGERFNFSQTFGRDFDRGGFALGYDYRKDEVLDLTNTGVVRAPSNGGRTPVPGLYYLRYPSEQHVGLFAGHFELTDKAELYADAQYSSDKNEGGQAFGGSFGTIVFESAQIVVTDSDQYSAVAGVRLDVGKDWQVDVSALHGVVDNTSAAANLFVFAPDAITTFDVPPTAQDEDQAKLTSFSAIADGPLGPFGGGAISAAIGIEFRDESYERTRFALPAGTGTPGENRDRDISSIFGEIHLPLISRNGQRLEVSLAGRYDEYSDFGDTFNPQLGVDWEPISGLTFRGSYSEAFRAPDLFSLDFANQIVISDVADPLAPGGTATVLTEVGGNPGLQPEEADTWTIGIDWEPSDRSRLSLSYFDIEYVNRIDEPAATFFTVLQEENLFSSLINRSPTAEELDEVIGRTVLANFLNFTGVPFDPTTDDPLAVFPGLVYFDNRRNNIAIEKVNGIDIQASTVLETGSGDWSFDLNGTYYLDFERNIAATAPAINQLNQPGKLVDLKLRGRIAWSRSAWSVNTYVNYVDGYDDTFAATPTKIASWTTVDLTLRFDASEITNSGILNGVRVTLGANNLFDEDPPVYLSHISGLGYDAANADAIGRVISVRIAKRW